MQNLFNSLKKYNLFNTAGICIVKFYQISLSYFFGGHCRHYPSCSNYAIQAFQKARFLPAFLLVFKRVSSCHPLSRKPFYDPIPFSYKETSSQ